MVYLILIIAAIGMLGGGLWSVHSNGIKEGKAECQAELKAADDKLRAEAAAREQEAANHITDMQAAFEVGESQAKTKIVTVLAKGAKDVATYPVFSNPACVLPPDSLRTLNATRGGMRTGTVDDSVLNGASKGTNLQPATNTPSSDAAVRGTGSANGGADKGSVSPDATGRRPLGKVH